MAGNLFSLKFVLVQEKEVIQKIAEACQQEFVLAPFVLVAVSDREKVKKMYDYNDKGFAQQQAGAAIQNILLSLTEKGIASCWVGFFDDAQIQEAIGASEKNVIEAVIPIGLQTKAKTQIQTKQKPDLENLVYFDKWGNKKMEPQTRVRHNYV
jgi:nitroreductase